MRNSVFAFENLNFSDTILHIEIESEIRKDLLWLKSFIKQIPFGDVECSTRSVKVRTLNVNSTILSAESLYFSKRFNEDGTKELRKKEVTLKIKAHEEAALIDLLNFMYINNLSATTPHQLESVRMIAEKLEATSCIRYLNKLSNALQHEIYRGEPSAAQPLKDAAKEDLLQRYMDLSKTKYQEEAMGLPLCALEVVLASPRVLVDSEDSLYHFIYKWATSNCSDGDEAEKVKANRLYRLIHFPYITLNTACWWLQIRRYFPLLSAFRFNDGTLYNPTRRIERRYLNHPISAVHPSHDTIVVYFFLTKKVLGELFVNKRLGSEGVGFSELGSRVFYLLAQCGKGSESDHFGLFLGRFKSTPDGIEFAYEFGVLTKKDEYRTMSNGENCSFSSNALVGNDNMLGVTWDELMAQDSEFLVEGTLHLRAKITIMARSPEKFFAFL